MSLMEAIDHWRVNDELRVTLMQAIEQLTMVQKCRMFKYCVQRKTLAGIAEEEGVCVNGVYKSIQAGTEKIRRFFIDNGMNCYFK